MGIPGSKQLVLWMICGLSGLAANLVHANFFSQLSLGAGQEENLSRGFRAADEHDSAFAELELTAGKLFQPGLNTSVVLSASLSHGSFFSRQGFNALGAGASVSLEHKFGLGPYTPRLGITAAATRDDAEGDARDRDLYSLGVNLGKRFSPAWSGSIAAARETSRGTSEEYHDLSAYYGPTWTPYDVFDYHNDVLSADLQYSFANGLLLSVAYQYTDGHIVSSAVPPESLLLAHAEAIAPDPAFSHPRVMYLLKSKTDSFSVGFNYPLGADTSLDLRMSRDDIQGRHLGGYDHSRVGLSLIHRF